MARQLAIDNSLVGKSIAEVRALLDSKVDPGTRIDDSVVYTVRERHYFSDAFLDIVVGPDERVVEVVNPTLYGNKPQWIAHLTEDR